MTGETIAACAGIVLSLVASYVPGFSAWWAQQQPDHRRLMMLFALAVSATAIFTASCTGVIDSVTCDREGLTILFRAFAIAVVANQSTFLISPNKPS